MNQLVRGSHLVQRLLGSGGAAKAVACSWLAYGAGPAAAVQPASWMLRPLSTDTESQGDDESAPKKRRGRPRKTTVEEAQHGAFGEAAAAVPEAAPVAVSEGPTESKAPEAPAVPSAGVSVSSPPPVDRPARSGPRRGRPWSFPQGIATVGAPSRVPEVFHSSTSITDLAPGSKGPVGQYVDVPQNVLPEGNAVFYHDPLLVDERVQQPDYGCKAVSAEFAASGRRVLLHRGATQSLLEAVAQGGVSGAEAAAPGSKTFYVDGWTGAGKSVALYSLAAAARAAGWIVMYVPSASLLVRGGRFYHSDIEDDPMWDTPEAARHIINALVGAHGDALKTLQAPGTGGKTLAEVAAAGLEPTSCARETVEAAIALKDGLLAHDSSDGVRTLVVVDDYNTLYSHTDYHEPMHEFYRRPIPADELRLASSFRLLERTEQGAGVAVVAPSFSAGVTPTLRLPRALGTVTLRVPRFNAQEVATVAAMLADAGAIAAVPSEHTLKRALALTNGNAKELREYSTALFTDSDPLGLSLGYKALAAAKVKYATTLR